VRREKHVYEPLAGRLRLSNRDARSDTKGSQLIRERLRQLYEELILPTRQREREVSDYTLLRHS
jgi:hypothetical protein